MPSSVRDAAIMGGTQKNMTEEGRVEHRWMLYQLSHLGSPPTPNFWLLPQDRKNVELVSNILPSLGAAQGTGFCLIWLGLPMGMVA